MKKRISILLSLTAALCLTISGCGGYETVTADPAEVRAGQAKAAAEKEAAEKEAAEKMAAKEAAEAAEDDSAEAAEIPATATEPAEPVDTTIRSILTNEEIDPEIKKQRPIAVMYPINYEAQPQYGLSNVDVFYEMIEEGTMSRQMGIIQDWQNLDLIGNIRSTRSYFVLEAMRYDPIMIHFGGPIDWLINVTNREDLDNLNGVGGVLGGDYGAFYRIDNGKALEHTAFTDPDHIRSGAAMAGYSLEIRDEYYEDRQFYFNAPDDRNTLKQYEDSIPATTIDMSGAFPVTQSSLVYNEEDHKYYKYLYGEPQCDAVTGEQMAFDNVIIQEAKFKYVGNHGYVDLDTISRGRNAYVLTEGRCVPAHWWRKGVHKHTTYYYKDKTRIHLNTGKTMIFIIRDHLDTFALDGVSYMTQGAPLTPVGQGEAQADPAADSTETVADASEETWTDPSYDNSQTYDDGSQTYDDGSQYYDDGSQTYDDGSQYYDDGSQTYDDGSQYYDDGSQTYDDGSQYYDDGSQYYDDGSQYYDDGSQYYDDGSQYYDDSSVYAEEQAY